MASFLWNLGRHWRILPRVARRFITVAETPLFSRQARQVWDDAELAAFIDFIARNPEEGDLIPETGGVRKIRWARPGSGKRGGAWVIYFYHSGDRPLYLLMVYAKARSGEPHGGRKEGRSKAGSDPEKLSDGQRKEQKHGKVCKGADREHATGGKACR
jgi:hypothetical protein